MNISLIIITALALSNLLIFLVLIIFILKARQRRPGSSFKMTPAKSSWDKSELAAYSPALREIPEVSKIIEPIQFELKKEVEAVCGENLKGRCDHTPQEILVR